MTFKKRSRILKKMMKNDEEKFYLKNDKVEQVLLYHF